VCVCVCTPEDPEDQDDVDGLPLGQYQLFFGHDHYPATSLHYCQLGHSLYRSLPVGCGAF